MAAAGIAVQGFTRRKATGRDFPDDQPRRRRLSDACCGDDRLSKIGKDVAETFDVVPRKWA
jgi:hypothetical protein